MSLFSSRRRHTRCGRDWSSDVCSSDLHDGHEERHRDDDAEQREERAELVAPRGLEGLQDGFGDLHGNGNVTAAGVARFEPMAESRKRRQLSARSYSYLSASTGSSLEARLAGYSPNPIPVS